MNRPMTSQFNCELGDGQRRYYFKRIECAARQILVGFFGKQQSSSDDNDVIDGVRKLSPLAHHNVSSSIVVKVR